MDGTMAIMTRSFVGRASELQHVEPILRSTEALWITGPAGIGKSRLAIEAIGERKTVYLDGHFMSTPAEALPYLAEVFGVSPETDRAVCLAQLVWLADDEHALARLAELNTDRRLPPGRPHL
jgi:hypothetical protein